MGNGAEKRLSMSRLQHYRVHHKTGILGDRVGPQHHQLIERPGWRARILQGKGLALTGMHEIRVWECWECGKWRNLGKFPLWVIASSTGELRAVQAWDLDRLGKVAPCICKCVSSLWKVTGRPGVLSKYLLTTKCRKQAGLQVMLC